MRCVAHGTAISAGRNSNELSDKVQAQRARRAAESRESAKVRGAKLPRKRARREKLFAADVANWKVRVEERERERERGREGGNESSLRSLDRDFSPFLFLSGGIAPN